MSKYTTEVRFICETEAGKSESIGFNDIDDVLELSWNKIFTTKCTFFNEEYRKPLCVKILKHYYTREIGAETVGLWKLWMNRKLEEIMPYYNKLYESELIEFNPLDNTKYSRTVKEILEGNNKENTTITSNNTSTDKSNLTINQTNNYTEAYSDTPQGSLSGVENMNYLTNATKKETTDESTQNINNSSENETNTSQNATREEDKNRNLEETIQGKTSGESFAKILNEYRETFLNIDMMIVEEFKDCFINLW